jgi:hypothetical protein
MQNTPQVNLPRRIPSTFSLAAQAPEHTPDEITGFMANVIQK